jgi:toxin-antitoxin system PIN domain toxin
MTTTFLLDVNLLLALCDPRHVHHESAHRWFHAVARQAWATCPIVENGFIRIASQPRYPNSPGGPAAVQALLKEFCRSPRHVFWPDAITLLDDQRFNRDLLLSPGQITDVYLLALAVFNGGKLATLDSAIPSASVAGGHDALELILA